MTVVLPVLVLGIVAAVLALRGAIDDGAVRAMVAVGGVGAVVLLAAVALGLGVDGSGPVDDDIEERPPPTTAPPSGRPLQDPRVHLTVQGTDELPAVPPVVGEVSDGDTILVSVIGLDPDSDASIHQCPAGATAPALCRPGLPVVGRADAATAVLLDLKDRFDAGGEEIDCAADGCSVVVFGSARLELRTVFDAPAPPPVTVTAEPATLPPGGEVGASATGLPPGASVGFAVCRPDGGGGLDCGAPSRVRATASGTADARLVVGAGRCGRGDTCAIAVSVDGSSPVAYQRLRLIGRSGAAYDDDRVLPGLALAGVLLVGALVLIRRTDWTPVGGDPFADVVIPEDPFEGVT